jgi:hypothetical protein
MDRGESWEDARRLGHIDVERNGRDVGVTHECLAERVYAVICSL